MVQEYNRNMGGVDKGDQIEFYYAVDDRNQYKYHMRLFYDLIDTCGESFIIHNMKLQQNNRSTITALEFRQAMDLLGSSHQGSLHYQWDLSEAWKGNILQRIRFPFTCQISMKAERDTNYVQKRKRKQMYSVQHVFSA